MLPKRILGLPDHGRHNPAYKMSTTAIVPQNNLNFSLVSFGEVRANKAGGKSIPIKYNGQNLQIRLEKAVYPMGVNIRENENGTTYTMSVSLRGCDAYAKERAGPEQGSTGALYNFLLDLQEGVLQHCARNSKKIFGKDRSLEVLRDTMKAFLSPSVEKVNGEWVPTGKYPPSLKMKVPVYSGEVAMDVTDHLGKRVEVDVDNLASVFPKRCEASIVVTPSIYITGTGFGVTWRITYAKVSPPQRLTAADVFKDEIEEEIRTPAHVAAGGGAEVPVFVSPEDQALEEETAEHEEVSVPLVAPPAPAPAPAPKSRRTVKTAAGAV